MYPLAIYFYELKWRFLYVIFSFFTCLFILLNYSEVVVLLQTTPLIKFSCRRFIATHVTELFNTLFYTSFFYTSFFTSPFILWQLYIFSIPGWSKSQLIVFTKTLSVLWFSFLSTYTMIHFCLIPKILDFFFRWEIRNKYSLLQIEIESRIENYLFWTIGVDSFISTSLLSFGFFTLILWLTLGPLFLYKILNLYKNWLIFLFFGSISFFVSFDLPSQFFLLLAVAFFIEVTFFTLSFSSSRLLLN